MSLADVCADEAAVHREEQREKGMVREGRGACECQERRHGLGRRYNVASDM